MTTDSNIAYHRNSAFSIRIDGGLTFGHLEWPSRTLLSEVALPFPSAGYGGAVLSISHHANFAAALLYSGQTEVGYELFALSPTLQHVGGMPYLFGECDFTPVQFSPDEALAAFASEKPFWWGDPNEADTDWDTPAVGGRAEWAALFVHRLGENRPSRHVLVVDVQAGWHPSEDPTWPAALRFESTNTLSLKVPWASRFSFEIPVNQQPILIPSPGR